MKLFFLGTIFGVGAGWLTRHASRITFGDFRCAVYFALIAWLLWNVSVWLRAKAAALPGKGEGAKGRKGES